MMRIVSHWYDEDHQVIYVHYQQGWSWEDLTQTKQQLDEMLGSVTWVVHVISDLRGANVLPSGSALSYLSRILAAMPDNIGILTTLGGGAVLQTLIEALQKLVPNQATKNIRFFSTLEEIHTFLEEILQHKLRVIEND